MKRAAILLLLGAMGAAAAWVFTQNRPPADVLRELGARVRGGTAAPPLKLPEHLRPRAVPPARPAPASFLPPSGPPLQPRELASGLDGVEDLAWSADGRFLVSAGYGDNSIRVWEVATGAPVQALRTHRRPKSVAVLPDGKGVLVADVYNHLRFYPWHESGRLGWGRARELEGAIGEIAVSPDGRLLASGLWHSQESGELVVLAIDDLSVVARAALPVGLRRPAFSPSGRWLAVGDSGRSFTLWDLASGEGSIHLVPRVGARSDVGSVAFSHDEQLLATGHMDSSITIWSLDGPRQRHNFYVPEASTWRVAFNPAEGLLATAQQGGAIHFWDPESARALAALRGHGKGVREIAWSRDGRQLASYGEDGKILLWGKPAEPSPAPQVAGASSPAPVASEMTQTDILRLLATVRGMQEIPEDQRRAIGEAANLLPTMTEQERAAFGATLMLIASSRELGQALGASLQAALSEGFGPAGSASDLGLDGPFLAWNLEALPEANPVVDGLRALARGDVAAIMSVLTLEMRQRFKSEGSEPALAEMQRRWGELKTAAGPPPYHLTFVGTPARGEIHVTSASGDLSKDPVPGDVNVPAIPVVKEDGVWRIGGL